MEANYIHSEDIHNTRAANQIIPHLLEQLKPKNIIDIGCGLGTWLVVAKQYGITEVLGVDGNKANDEIFLLEDGEFLKADLTKTLVRAEKFDLAICLEVAEHLPPDASDTIIETLVNSGKVVLFSAAIPLQGGQNHLNEQWPNYWLQKFKKYEYLPFDVLRPKFWNNDAVEWWYRQNMVIYAPIEFSAIFGQPAIELANLVHPNLFSPIAERNCFLETQVIYQNEQLERNVWKPKFFPTLKLLIKSIIR